jgi:hypothetical protein
MSPKFENTNVKSAPREPIQLNEPFAKSAEEARVRASVLIFQSIPQIVELIIAKAKEGSLHEAKLLLDIFGLSSEPREPKSAKSARAEAKSSAKENEPNDDTDVPPLARLLMETLNAFDRGELKSS